MYRISCSNIYTSRLPRANKDEKPGVINAVSEWAGDGKSSKKQKQKQKQAEKEGTMRNIYRVLHLTHIGIDVCMYVSAAYAIM